MSCLTTFTSDLWHRVSCAVTSWPLTLHLSAGPYCQPYPWLQKDNFTVALYIFWLATCELFICNRLYLNTDWPSRQHWLKLERAFLPNIHRNGRLSSLEISSGNQRSSRALQRERLKTHSTGATYHPKPITQEYTNVQNGYCLCLRHS